MRYKDVKNKINEQAARVAATDHNARIKSWVRGIDADEKSGSYRKNSAGDIYDHNRWALQDFIDRAEAKRELKVIGRPETEANITWMAKEISDRRHARLLRHKNSKKSGKS